MTTQPTTPTPANLPDMGTRQRNPETPKAPPPSRRKTGALASLLHRFKDRRLDRAARRIEDERRHELFRRADHRKMFTDD